VALTPGGGVARQGGHPQDGGEPPLDYADLLERASSGDEIAFERIVNALAAEVYRHCYRLCGEQQAAEDILSATFFELWRKADDVRLVRGKPTAWLIATATNLSRNRLRSDRRFRRLLMRLSPPADERSAEDLTSERLEAQHLSRRLREVLADLSALDRQIVGLCLIAEYTYRDAAAVLGVTEPTVRTRLSRCRREIRTRLDDGDRTPKGVESDV
jgi:RNA polymerase sigma factor (sigma-70 family)